MVQKSQSGFTIVEVMLFLAITGLLFLIGFLGTGAQLQQVRFTDSMRSLHSFLQKQYSLVSTGANPRAAETTCTVNVGDPNAPPVFGAGAPVAGDTAGDDSECVLLGKLVKFTPDSSNLTTYYVVGRRLPNSQLTGNDLTDLVNSRPTLSDQAVDNTQINWSGTFYLPPSVADTNLSQAMAFLRSPSSGRIMTFAFPKTAVNDATAPGSDTAFRSALTSDNFAQNSGYCVQGTTGNRKAIIKLGYDQRTDAIDVAFDNFNPQTDCVRKK